MFKVVLVDDELYARQGLKQFTDWNKYGFDIVAEAANGEEALHVIEQTQPDLVVTDIRMPVLDGLELIRAVKERKKAEPSFIIVSGYGDFKYAQKAVRFGVNDFILKPIDEEEMEQTLQTLSETLSRNMQFQADRARLLGQSFFESLLTGTLEKDLSPDMMRAMGLRDDEELRYFDVELNDLQLAHDYSEGRWKTDVADAIASAIGQESIYVHERQRGVFGFVAGKQSWTRHERCWKQFAVLLQQRLRDQLGANVILYGGKAVSAAELIPESFRTAGEAWRHKYASAGNGPLLFEEMEGCPVKYLEMDDSSVARLMVAIEENDPLAVSRMIDEIFERFLTERYAPDAVVRTITRFFFGVVRIIESMQGDKNELLSLDAMHTWSQTPATLQGLKARFISFVQESSAYIAELRKNNTKGSIQKIKQYIEEHYDQNLSLKSIAAVFYMNPVYLGQLFKKTYGVYFNEFLLQTRMKEAKRLLRQTGLRVYEIADKIGYNNADYFVTQFEKAEQKTPSEYRSAMKSNK
ncbi:response regulator transcription factor [Paenibacillus alkaliterrae]|uniref:response regulator transcription factor n=1 Tax=Paenibacillus alkaliterrae TaxID=320909 RepID=UPI001F25B940|nr:response regulator transcription factor [Paenibacillus alkaliterrae]MCF2940878.1 response regulator transcription factor [Paenibacillus alkaliterrae]